MPFSTTAGVVYDDEAMFDINMVNTNSYQALEFNIYVPEFIHIDTEGVEANSGRMPGPRRNYQPYHSISVSDKGNGHYYVTVVDINVERTSYINGDDGTLFSMYYTTDDNVTPGIYPIRVEGTVLGIDGNNGVFPATSVSYVKIGTPATNVVYNLGGTTVEQLLVPSFVQTELNTENNVVVNGTCESLVLTDGYDFHAPVAFEAKNASYSRTVAQDGWYSLVLPFAAEVPGGVTVEKFQSLDEAGSMATFAKVMTMEGDVPYIFEATAGSVEFEAQNVAVAATPAALTDGAFTGTYATTEAGSVTGQYALRADGTGFGVCDATAYVPAFRAWLQAAGGASNIRIAHDGVTAIQSAATDAATDCYDLSGRRVSSRAKGVVINNSVKQIKK